MKAQPGQIWRDKDTRSGLRYVTVLQVDSERALVRNNLTGGQTLVALAKDGSIRRYVFEQSGGELDEASKLRAEVDELRAWLDIVTTAAGMPDHAWDPEHHAAAQMAGRYSAEHQPSNEARDRVREIVLDVAR